MKYFLTVHYFVVIMSTFPYRAYINVLSSHYNIQDKLLCYIINVYIYILTLSAFCINVKFI